jgi:hypothetical protein
MNRKVFTVLVAVALIAASASAQVDGAFKARPLFAQENGKPAVFGVAAAANLSIYYDTTSGFTSFTESGAVFTHRDNPDEVQGAYLISYNGMAFNDVFGKLDAYIALGFGDIHLIRSGEDEDLLVIAADAGVGFSKKIALGGFGWYTPANNGAFYGLGLTIKPWF